jgi:hypothetical protein
MTMNACSLQEVSRYFPLPAENFEAASMSHGDTRQHCRRVYSVDLWAISMPIIYYLERQ